MASSPSFVQYIVDQCGGAGDITVRKMFGDYCIYCYGKVFGLISDNRLFVKPTEEGRKMLHSEILMPPYDGAKPYFLIEEIDDHNYLTQLVKVTVDALPDPKPKKASRR